MKGEKALVEEDMLAEYDFSKGTRGKYAEQYARGNNVVVLSPELMEIFPNSEAVNEALRALVRIARQSTKEQPHSDRRDS